MKIVIESFAERAVWIYSRCRGSFLSNTELAVFRGIFLLSESEMRKFTEPLKGRVICKTFESAESELNVNVH